MMHCSVAAASPYVPSRVPRWSPGVLIHLSSTTFPAAGTASSLTRSGMLHRGQMPPGSPGSGGSVCAVAPLRSSVLAFYIATETIAE